MVTSADKMDEIVRALEGATMHHEGNCLCGACIALTLVRELRDGAVEGHSAYDAEATRKLIADGYDMAFYRGTEKSCDLPALLIVSEPFP